jgi:hypothetical protein
MTMPTHATTRHGDLDAARDALKAALDMRSRSCLPLVLVGVAARLHRALDLIDSDTEGPR